MEAPKKNPDMMTAFIRLHVSILLAGFTGILGKLIVISEGMLVWYRVLLTMVILCLLLAPAGRLHRVSLREFARIGGVGVLLCLHWIFFYGSIKASNVSVGVVCFALVGFFTALLDPIFSRRSLSGREVLFSLLSLLGIALIFSFDTRYRVGIGIGVVSSLMAALFTIANKRVCAAYNASTMLIYEMAGGFIFMSCLLPFYITAFDITYLVPTGADWLGLFLLSFFCTVMMCLLQLQALRFISAFTVNLSFNLEPVYSIIIAIAFLQEGRELGVSFYVGLVLIMLSVALQSWVAWRERKALPIP